MKSYGGEPESCHCQHDHCHGDNGHADNDTTLAKMLLDQREAATERRFDDRGSS